MPKDIPAAIVRTLGLPQAGAFISYEQLSQLDFVIDGIERELQRDILKAFTGMERARTSETRDKWSQQAAEIMSERNQFKHYRTEVARVQEREELPPLASPDVIPVSRKHRDGDDDDGDGDELPEDFSADEWEFGQDYAPSGKDSPSHSRSSNVKFNARIWRKDGLPIARQEVVDVVDYFASTGEWNDSYEISTVSWENWKGAETNGAHGERFSDLENFRSILQVAGVRVGAVKPNTR